MPKGIYERTEKHRKNLSLAWKYDKHFTKQCREKISKANKDKVRTNEAKEKYRICKLGQSHTAWNKGLTKENDARVKKISDSSIKNWNSKEYKSNKEIKSSLMKERRKTMILPTKDTKIEIKIQDYLKQLGIEFFTHQHMNVQHSYQCDILIPSKNMVIECDGNYWHNYPIGNQIDHVRTSELLQKGFKVLRLWEIEIKTMNLEQFKNKLNNHN